MPPVGKDESPVVDAPSNREDSHCVYKQVARLLAEEPQLEAVAFQPKNQLLSIATLGVDNGQRIAGRVTEAVAERERQCGIVNALGNCEQCGEPPSRKVGDANVVVKDVLGSTVIEKLTCRTATRFWQWNKLRWPRVSCCGQPATDAHPNEWKRLALFSALCLFSGLAALAAQFFGVPSTVVLGFFAVSYITGAWDAATESWQRLRNGVLEIHFLMLAVAFGAALIGAWSEGALLLFLFSASGAMEHFAAARTQREIGALLRGAPKTATVLEAGAEHERAVESLAAGMQIRVRSGEQVPVDLRVTRGESACDESNLTGESRPVPKQPGDVALAGTLNLWGVLDGEALRPSNESALQKIVNLIAQAQHLKAPSQRFSDRFGTHYTYLVLTACAAFFTIGWLAFGWPPFVATAAHRSAFYRAMTLLVVMSPCALVLSVPSAILSAIASGARRGVLFRGGAAIETLADVRTVALDKTGTLTQGVPELVRIDTFAGEESAIITAAYNLARLSHHPLSRALQRVGAQRGASHLNLTHADSHPGRGLTARGKGLLYVLGNYDFVRSSGAAVYQAARDEQHDVAEVWVAGPGICGRFLLRDQLRPEARRMLDTLRRTGIRTVMLTGDRAATADLIAREAGLDDVRAQLSPEAKVAAVQELKQGGGKVAMIGDGVNDAPSLAAADVGVAMGARGSDAAMEQAEVVLMNDKLESFVTAFQLSRRAKRIIGQNITIALGTVVAMAILALVRGIPLSLGVVAHEGSTVLVVLNSLRLLVLRRD
ncbi:MAG: heavy metal translocating P-type ATPase [Verrucomicrobiota bacterium]|nr:heavy metal translocating P-type ATPase [Verrucomicrobiota bacterium]